MRLITILALIALCAAPARALDPNVIGANTVASFKSWMEDLGVTSGAIVVSFEGKVIASAGMGRRAEAPAKLASLSKAITAVCTLKALGARDLSTDLTLREAIPQALAGVRLFDPNLADVTIGQLMTHRSGLHSRYHRGLEVLRTFKKENKAWQFSKIAKERLMARPGFAPYHYNNANYLTLGLVIEELTGEPYESYCRNEILDPIGVTTAKLNDTWRVMSAWGGWEMSAADYMRFAQVYFAKGRHFDAAQGIALTAADLEKGRHYGPGVLFAANPTGTTTGTTVWHSGSWRWHGRLADKFGAYFALYDNGFAVSVNYDHDAYNEWAALDAALYKATHP